MAKEHMLTVGGRQVPGEQTFPVHDPATGDIVGLAPDASRRQIDEAIAESAGAFDGWRADAGRRRAAMHAAATALAGAVDELAPLLTREQGKPLANSRGEVATAVRWLRFFADFEPEPETFGDATTTATVTRRPLGVTVAITPWNVPLVLAAWKIAPALLVGNTVIVKPSPYTPLSTLAMVRVMNQALPPGVLSAVSGQDRIGPWLTGHPVPRKVSFTGSTPTGRKVGQSALETFKRFTLELGGNDPAILLDDVDVDSIADLLFRRAFANAGQVCLAVKRVYVPTRLHDALTDALVARACEVVLGHGLDPDTTMGPLNNRAQLDTVVDLIADSRDRGATIAAGAPVPDGPGLFHTPTIVTGLSAGDRLVEEEQFGPVLPIVAYGHLDDVLAEVNASSFGLAGSVWSADPDRAARIAPGIDAGTVWINDHGGIAPDRPFGGVKSSGLGVEHGRWGVESMTDVQTVVIPRPTQT